ncbi:hypothetical protein ILUMI_11612 [Ignelater luminosus]|uniref:AP complex subunit beta n=1 Tax=Ignelater luminosus TaxID=2038154 RepID=A0A8K0CVW9_IGNLU|nr:hypothetical protein ILUMI_11612 [Ignelater luminosus]
MSNDNEVYKSEWVAEAIETEYQADPAYGGFFNFDYKKHDDLRQMLDSSRDGLKLEAMKRIIEMIAKGKDVSNLFPAVVKNVVSKNIEVKKLVYVYLVRYAEEQQDLVLLSISTFQRALKEPNQLIRAGALRILSNIRVAVIVPIVMLAIRDAAADLSPYVRKTAAHAIPKLYHLDQKLKSELVVVIQKLLQDTTVLVVGSAVMAYTEVCPERIDLVHKIFRKLCALLADVDEWGQVVIVNMLTRYARTQFVDPNENETEKDPDHQLLLHCTYPLLQSRNSAVVMAVAQLYFHCASKNEFPVCVRALVRLLHSNIEIQNVVLDNMVSISLQNKGMCEPYLKNFFVRTSDPTKIKLLKLDILTNIVTDSNIALILRELQTYIISNDKKFVAASIQAIGRCACTISEITDSCLNGLVTLLSNKDEAIVAESIIVIKRLLQTQAANCKEIITQMTRLLGNITIPQARAAILWLLGEHSSGVPLIAPDVLRKVSKTFPDEHDIVKLQILNLAIKLYITNSQETELFCQYVFDLARYDQNYDIRDRARLMKQFIRNPRGTITSQAARIFLTSKPAPLLNLHVTVTDQEEYFQLGTLSHYINAHAIGYEPLLPFPIEPPSRETRDTDNSNVQETKNEIPVKSENSSASSSSDSNSSSTESSSSNSTSDFEDITIEYKNDVFLIESEEDSIQC